MAGKAKMHMVDGEWTTVAMMAEELGVSYEQLCGVMYSRGISLQIAVSLIRDNRALGGQGRADRHMVDGRWMTVRQAAEMLGIPLTALRDWIYSHRQPDGSQARLADAVEAYRMGGVKRGGRSPRQHRVGNRTMTAGEAAEMLNINVWLIRERMSRHKCSLAAAIRYYERKNDQRKKDQAEKDILNILGF